MPPRHTDDLFSLAYDGQLSDSQRQRFDAHLRECAECRSGYEHFQTSVDALRALPAARMPRQVHLPSTPPVAERRTPVRLGWPGFLRYRVGLASGLAAAAAVALVVVAVTHQAPRGASPTGSYGAAAVPAQRGAGETGGAAETASCPRPASSTAGAPPASFSHRSVATDAARPGQQLLLATTSGQAEAGAQVPVYAVLTASLPVAGNRGAPSAGASIAAIPCVTAATPLHLVPAGPLSDSAEHGAAATGAKAAQQAPGDGAALFYVTVPSGTPSGTTLRVMATIPAGYPDTGNPAITAELTITVR
jgi:hypothetical protein